MFAETNDGEPLNRLTFNTMTFFKNEDTPVKSPFGKEKKERKIKN